MKRDMMMRRIAKENNCQTVKSGFTLSADIFISKIIHPYATPFEVAKCAEAEPVLAQLPALPLLNKQRWKVRKHFLILFTLDNSM